METINKDRRCEKGKSLELVSIGGLGNTLFGVFNLLRQAGRVEVLCGKTFDEFKGVIGVLWGEDRVSVKKQHVEVTDAIKAQNCGNPHMVRDEVYGDGERIACFAQVMPPIELIKECRENVAAKVPLHENVVIHVRRGDFLDPANSPFHPVMDRYFYQKAMSYFDADTAFVVISDDIEWCKENIKGPNISYSEGTSSYDDFLLLLGAKGCIYGNSTFGYMGALLNPREDKTVVACKNWYRADISWNNYYKTVYPEHYPDKLILVDYLYV